MEGCGAPKALKSDLNFLSSADICDDSYSPVNISSQNKPAATPSPFEINKIQLSNSSSQKVDHSLKGREILFTLDLSCDLGSSNLAQQVFNDNPANHTHLSQLTLPYTFQEEITEDELSVLINNDDCIIGVSNSGTMQTASLAMPVSNDPGLSFQNYLTATNYLHAFEYLAQKQGPSSDKVKVAFVDTGAHCSHSDFAAHLVSGCGYNAVSPGSSPNDNDGHGSHTLGMVAAVTDNGVGIMGLAGDRIEAHAIKVINMGSGSAFDVANGIQEAINRGVDVINISLESQSQLTSVEQAVYNAISAGVVVVMAAGNHAKQLDGTQSGVYSSPGFIGANLPGAITVGSVDALTHNLSSYSNYGSRVEIATVGAYDSNQSGSAGGLYSTNLNNGYTRLMGTSQAAPIITAAASLLIQFFKEKGVSYNAADIEAIIAASSDTVTGLQVSNQRRFNFSKLVRNAYYFADVPLCE